MGQSGFRVVNNMADKLGQLMLVFLLSISTIASQDNETTIGSTSTAASTVSTTIPTTTTTTQVPTEAPSTIPPYTDLAECTCDLTANGCDINCCCDQDCTAEDIQTFSTCIDSYTPPDRQACVKRSIIFKDNTPFEKNEADPDLFCVIRDNYAQRNYYELPNAVDTEEKFTKYREKYGGSSYMPVGRDEVIPTGFYKSGDPVLVLYSSMVLGKLGLPRAMVSRACVDNNPTAFLVDESFACVRLLASIQKACTTNPALSAQTFYKDFKIIKNPQAVTDVINQNNTDNLTDVFQDPLLVTLYNSSLVLSVQLADSHFCIDQLGVSVACNNTADTPTLEKDGSADIWFCNSAIVKVEYMLEYNGTAGISNATVRFTYANLTDTNLPLTQTFASTFTKMGGVSAPFERSGNPGYVIGQPLLAGNLTSETLPDDTVRKWIQLNSDRDNWLTITRSSVVGDCDNQDGLRIPVTFGENLRSGCQLVVTYSNMTSQVCRLLQEQIIQTLLGPTPPTHVAVFGNSSPEKTGDWIQILTEKQPEGVTDTSGGCLEMSLGLHIEVMYASVGALGNPQAKVIGVNFRWEDPTDIFFQCSGPFCLPESEETLTQSFEVVSSVSYIDASNKANGAEAEKPQFTAKLPEDFFYPFT